MRKGLFFLAAVFILAGCSRTLEQPAPMKKGETFIWNTQASADATKTTLEGTTLSWVSGDKIGIFIGDIQKNIPFINTEGNSFDGVFGYKDDSALSINYYAYYPYVSQGSPTTTITATLPTDQTAPFDASANYMVANVVAEKYDEADMPEVNFQFNNQLMSIVKVTVKNTYAEYASQKLLGVSLVATKGETLTGKFTFDLTNPASSPVFSVTPSEVSSKVTGTFPEANQPTLGSTGTGYSLYLLVNSVEVDDLKLLIKTTDKVFVATTTTNTVFEKGKVVSLPAIDIKNLTPQRRVRRVLLWGDSITSTIYRDHMQSQLGNDWEVIRGGIPGDTPLGIAGRQGAIPLCLKGGFTIPASNSESVVVGTPYSTKKKDNTEGHSGLGKELANYYATDPGSLLNPCIIKYDDVQIEGRLTDNGNGWNFTRTTGGDAVTIPAEAWPTLLTYASHAYKDVDVSVIYMGANVGWSSNEALRDFYQQMIDYTNSKKVVVVGFHMRDVLRPAGTFVYWTPEYQAIFQTAFPLQYLDLNTEGTTHATDLLVATGRLAPGESMNKADQDAVNDGYWPESFASSSNYTNVHLNTYGSKAMAILVREKMEQLGYLDY